MEANQETDNETWMNCIRKCRASYDKSSTDYKVPLKKNNARKEISKKLSIEETEVKTRYSNIRTNFSKYIKRGDHQLHGLEDVTCH